MRSLARRLALPVAALSAALALTACQSGDTSAAAPKAPSQPSARTTGATPQPAPTGTPTGTPTGAPANADTTRPTAAPTSRPTGRPGTQPAARPQGADRVPCTAANTKIVASKVSRPINHLVLTVTNVGSRPCDAPHAPLVGFDHSQAPIRVLQGSKPQAVLGLAPGESGYASVILTGEPGGPGEDTHGTTVRTIRVNITPDSSTTVTAPSGTYADDGAAVSYWQQTLEDALTY
ncbi:DUF4232 domain-containing protein [Streptomyces roseoviridis]|uniref:DUF4232 domain-containing protein n=1 Tax=Streptomyces roseoviridis TaxID=67361 RepID=A0ABV5QVF8_9ACTN